jgi:hypothetical protein
MRDVTLRIKNINSFWKCDVIDYVLIRLGESAKTVRSRRRRLFSGVVRSIMEPYWIQFLINPISLEGIGMKQD